MGKINSWLKARGRKNRTGTRLAVNSAVSCSFNSLLQQRKTAHALLKGRLPKSAVHISGELKSLFHGRGMEYRESRIYQMGDDVRTMDWRVTARTNTPHVKVFQDEKERPVYLVVDQTASMHFASRRQFKSVMAARLAALLAWVAANFGDKLGGLVIKPEGNFIFKPLAGDQSVLNILKKIAFEEAYQWHRASRDIDRQRQQILTALGHLSENCPRGSLILMFSDFYFYDGNSEKLLHQLGQMRDLVLFHISDPLERQPLPKGQYKMSDGDEILQMNNEDSKTLAVAAQEFSARWGKLTDFCQRNRIHLIDLSTEMEELSVLHHIAKKLAAQQTTNSSPSFKYG